MVDIQTTKKVLDTGVDIPFPAIVGQPELKETLLTVGTNDELDGLCARINQLVVRDLIDSEATVEADVDAVLPAVRRLLLTVREIERIGDHAVNVAARTYYAVESDAALLR